MHTLEWLLSLRHMFLQLVSHYVEPVAWSSFSSQLVQCDHPTLRKGFSAFLATQSTWKYDQVLVRLPQYICLVDLVGCHPEASWLLYPIPHNVFGGSSAIGQVEWRGHESHGLRHLIHLVIILCPEGCKLHLTDTTQGHRLRVSVRDDLGNHVYTWECRVSKCNLVQVRLMNIHVHLMVFEVFPKISCECFIHLLPLKFDVLVQIQLRIIVD